MKRWPIIRHVRYFIWSWRVERHYDNWAALGFFPVKRDSDDAVLDAIWRGER